jgi:hypothetical protein
MAAATEAEMPPKQMSYDRFSRELGRSLADCFDETPAATTDSKSGLERGVAEALGGLEKESGAKATQGSPGSSGLRGRLEALHRLWR